MNKDDQGLLIKGAVVVGAFVFVVRPLMNALGVNPADTATVNSLNALPANQNPFSPVSQTFINCFYKGTPPLPSDFTYYKTLYDSQGDVKNGTDYDLVVDAEFLRNSIGYIYNDTIGIMNVFAGLRDKASVGFIEAYLHYNYNIDIISLLDQGAWQLFNVIKGGIGDTNIAAIINHVNGLPDCLQFIPGVK